MNTMQEPLTKIALVGSPNVGKSLLFNQLTGLNHKVANFPGATVSIGTGNALIDKTLKFFDYPGIYSMQGISGEELIAIESFSKALEEKSVDGVICVLDASRLEKSLFFGLQIQALCNKHNIPLLFAANMIDVLEKNSLTFNHKNLAEELQTEVIPISAKSKKGFAELFGSINNSFKEKKSLFSATKDNDDSQKIIASDADPYQQKAQELSEQFGPKGDLLIKSQNRIDQFLLSTWTGGLAFFVIMYLLFQSIFTWASPLMDGVEMILEIIVTEVVKLIPQGIFEDFVVDALFGGFGAFLVFVPQIFILTFIVCLLEDSGYLARAAIICHRPFRFFGLTGKSFIPMLSGMACAIPGIYAARTIESPVRRRLTLMAIPLMPCSARLPVYSLLIAAFIPASTLFGGLFGLQGLAMFSIYLFGIFFGLLVTGLTSRFYSDTQSDIPFILEVPAYRMPNLKPLLRTSWDRAKTFLLEAAPIIFIVSVVVWVLGYFPNNGEDLGSSYLAKIGQFIQPVFEPFDLDWRYGVAIITSFLAREVFVGTLGTLLSIDDTATENVISLSDRVQAQNLPLSAGIALLVFFSIALMCVSTLAVLKRESGSWKFPIQMFIAYGILAYVIALMFYYLTEWIFI